MNGADCTDTNNECQDKIVCMKESDNQLITYSKDKGYSQSQVMIVTNKGTLHAFTVALALSVHSIFEGLAFGLQNSTSQVCEYVYCISMYTHVRLLTCVLCMYIMSRVHNIATVYATKSFYFGEMPSISSNSAMCSPQFNNWW